MSTTSIHYNDHDKSSSALSACCSACRKGRNIDRETLKHCGGCGLTYYCNADCMSMHWPEHKATCKRIQAAKKAFAEKQLDKNYPLDNFITGFDLNGLDKTSMRTLLSDFLAKFIFKSAIWSFDNVKFDSIGTLGGYSRLGAIVITLLNDFSDDIAILELTQKILASYLSLAMGNMLHQLKLEALFDAGVLSAIINCLHKYDCNIACASNCFSALCCLAGIERSKPLKAMVEAGIMGIALLSLQKHGKNEIFCSHCISLFSNLTKHASFKGAPIPELQDRALAIALVVTLRRFPSHKIIQQHTLITLFSILDTTPDKTACAIALCSLGVFELMVAAMKISPNDPFLVYYGAMILFELSKEYFKEQSKPRSTADCMQLLAVCAQESIHEASLCRSVIQAIDAIMDNKPSSAKEFLVPVNGLAILSRVLEINYQDCGVVCCTMPIISELCSSATDWGRASPERALVIASLDAEMQPVLCRCLQAYLHKDDEFHAEKVLYALEDVFLVLGYTREETLVTVREVLAQYSSSEDIQEVGARLLQQRVLMR